MAFKCWQCGACCRFIGFKIPEFDRGDKACIHLTEENTCAIYKERPEVCRLDPSRDPKDQEKWCKLQEANWERYVKMLEGNDKMTDLELAIKFHDTYERLAPQFGYKTREDTKTFDPDSANGRLMIAVCREILSNT